MATLQDIRQQFPQYNDLSDQQLADSLYAKHYADMPRADFDKKIGIQSYQPSAVDYTRAAAQGLTFNFADEGEAAVRSLGGADYDASLGEIRGANERFKKERPTEALLTEIAGSIPTAFIGGVPNTIGKAALAGLTYGGLSGLGSGEGAGDRLAKGAGGAAIGGASGGALSGLLAGATRIPGAIQAGKNFVQSGISDMQPQNKAMALVMDAMNADQINAASIQSRLQHAKKTGLPLTALDVASKDIGGNRAIGSNLEGLADAAANMPGKGASMAGQVASRQQSQRKRISQALDEALGKGDVYDVTDDILAKIDEKAGPAYEKAYANEEAINTPKLNRLLERPAAKSAIKDAVLKAKNEGVDLGPMDMFEGEKTGYLEGFNTRTFDYIKRSLDDMIERSGKNQFGKLNNDGRILTQLKSEILKEVDKANPDFASARKIYGDQASRKTALDAGRDFMSMDREEISRLWQGAGDAERASFASGVRRAVQDHIDRLGDNADAVGRIWKEDIRGKLRPIFPNEKAYREFSKKMELERRMAIINNRLTRGSQTNPRTTYQAKINEGPEVSSSKILRGMTSPASAALEGAVTLMSSQLQKRIKNMNPETAHEIMKILLSNDPKKIRAVEAYAKSKGINPNQVINNASMLPIPSLQQAIGAVKSIPRITITPKKP